MTKNAIIKNPAAPVSTDPMVPLLAYQVAAIENPARFTWSNWSRQTGKSFTFALRRLRRGMERNRNQILLSAGGRQSLELMEKVRLHLRAIRSVVDCSVEEIADTSFEGTKVTKLEIRVRATDGSFDFRIIALPANPMTARGYTGDVFLDEFAMHRDDVDIWRALLPTIMRGGGELDVASTPRGRKNTFYRLQSNEWFSHSRVTILDAVADGLEVDVEALREALNDDDGWQQEFMCKFLDEATAFLTYEMISECEDPLLDKVWDDAKREACRDEDLYIGVDIGRRRDLTVIWIWGQPKGTSLLITRGVIELLNTPFAEQEAILYPIISQPNTGRCCIDETGLGIQFAERAVERFGAHRVEPITFTQSSKNEMATGFRIKVEDATARIPVDNDIRNDLHSVQRQTLPGGSIRYAADRRRGDTDGHADRFWGAALGIRAASSGGFVPFEFESVGEAAFAGEGV